MKDELDTAIAAAARRHKRRHIYASLLTIVALIVYGVFFYNIYICRRDGIKCEKLGGEYLSRTCYVKSSLVKINLE